MGVVESKEAAITASNQVKTLLLLLLLLLLMMMMMMLPLRLPRLRHVVVICLVLPNCAWYYRTLKTGQAAKARDGCLMPAMAY